MFLDQLGAPKARLRALPIRRKARTNDDERVASGLAQLLAGRVGSNPYARQYLFLREVLGVD